MTREQAQREGRKRWGVKSIVRAHESLSSPERRAEADVLFQTAKNRIEAIDKEVDDRIKAMEWYQVLQAERKVMRGQKEANMWQRSYHKFSVGYNSMGIAFHVSGEGDTWEEAFQKADADKRNKDWKIA